MKSIKIFLFAQIIILLVSCSTNNFHKRKYTKGRYIESSSNYNQKPSKQKNKQYANNTKKGESKAVITKKKKESSVKKNVIVDKTTATKTERKVNIKAINKKLKPIRKLVQKTTSIPLAILKMNSVFKDNSNKQKLQEKDVKENSYWELFLLFLIITVALFALAIILAFIGINSYVAFFILYFLIGLLFFISLITTLVFLLLWLIYL